MRKVVVVAVLLLSLAVPVVAVCGAPYPNRGSPTGKVTVGSPGLIVTPYARGMSVVNPTKKPEAIYLSSLYRVAYGKWKHKFVVPAKDSIFLWSRVRKVARVR